MDPLYLVVDKKAVMVVNGETPAELANNVIAAIDQWTATRTDRAYDVSEFTVNAEHPKWPDSWAVPGVDKPATPHPAGWPLARAFFQMDGCEDMTSAGNIGRPLPIPGYELNLFDWNGWAQPAFELPVFLEWYARVSINMDISVFTHDPSGQFRLTIRNVAEEPYKYEGHQYFTEDGPKLLFAVGAGDWCWDKIDHD